jgi:glycosyltransferase involved in cell wall biosynthesis
VAVGDRASVLVVPLAPAATGNGLAMRAGMVLEALAGAGAVDVVIVPVSGGATGREWLAERARRVVVVEPDVPRDRTDVVARLADPDGRAALAAVEGLPARAKLAHPALVITAVDALRDRSGATPTTVVVLRSYLAPFGVTLAHALGAARVVVDADDDDEGLARVQGDERAAAEHAELARRWLSQADLVVAASPLDAAAMSDRYDLAVATLPNAVVRPSTVPEPPGRDRLLFVGNLTYPPNIAAARELVLEILPALRRSIPDATVDVVGAHDERLADLVDRDGVHLAGAVADLAPWYAGADIVVVPIRDGAGTRIKVLEAFAHRRPVVATPAAVAGLQVDDGRSVLLGERADALAAHAARLLRTPHEVRRMVDEASAVLAEHYLLDVVAPRARRLLIGTD